MQLTSLVITVVIGAICTRTALTDTDSHAVDLGPGSDGLVGWRRDTLSHSIVVFDRLQFTDAG